MGLFETLRKQIAEAERDHLIVVGVCASNATILDLRRDVATTYLYDYSYADRSREGQILGCNVILLNDLPYGVFVLTYASTYTAVASGGGFGVPSGFASIDEYRERVGLIDVTEIGSPFQVYIRGAKE